MPDFAKIARNINRIIDKGGKDRDIEEYLAYEGVRPEDYLNRNRIDTSGRTEPAFDPMGNPTGAEQPALAPNQMPYGQQLNNVMKDAGAFDQNMARDTMDTATLGLADRGMAAERNLREGIPYARALEEEQKKSAEPGIAHYIGGGVGAILPAAAMARAGLTTYNMARNAPLLARMGLGAGEAAGYGAANAVGHAPDLTSPTDLYGRAWHGAKDGAYIGAAVPLVGAVAGAIGSRFSPQAVPGVSRQSSRLLENAAYNNREGLATATQRLGPEGMPVDIGPSFRGLGQGVTTHTQTEGGSALVNALERRQNNRADRLATDIRENLGQPQEVPVLNKEITAERKAVTGPMFEDALNSRAEVNTQPVLDLIDQHLKAATGDQREALLHIKKNLLGEKLTAPPEYPSGYDIHYLDHRRYLNELKAYQTGTPLPVSDPRILHNIKQDIDDMITNGADRLGIKPGALSREEGSVKAVRAALKSELHDQVPGYKAAAEASQPYYDRQRGLEKGYKEVLRPPSINQPPVGPQELSDILAKASPDMKTGLTEGARAQIADKVAYAANDLSAVKSATGNEAGPVRQKLKQLFPEDKIDNLGNAVKREQEFSKSHGRITAGSDTARNIESARAIDSPAPTVGHPYSARGALVHAGSKIANALIRAKGLQMGIQTRNELGPLLARPFSDPGTDTLIGALQMSAARRAAARNAVDTPGLANALATRQDERQQP